MRILHVISSIAPQTCGPAIALAGLTAALVQEGVEATIAATYRRDEGTAAAELFRRSGTRVRLIGPARDPLCRHPDLVPVLEELIAEADIVHIHALWEQIQHDAARLARRRGVPYIIRPCGMLDPWSLAQGRLKKRLYLRWRLRHHLDAAQAIHFTTYLEHQASAALKLRSRVVVEPNGVNLQEFAALPPCGTWRAAHPELGSRPVVLFLGRLHLKKGLELLIPAFAQAGIGDAVLVIAGPGAPGYRRHLDELIAQHLLQQRVIFTGMLTGADRIAALVDAELFVLPSHAENFGNAVVEALAAGTPVVTSDQVGLHAEIAAAGVGGVVPLVPEALASELTRWLGDVSLRRGAAARARPFVQECFDWRKIARRWVSHYEHLIQCPHPHSVGLSPVFSSQL